MKTSKRPWQVVKFQMAGDRPDIDIRDNNGDVIADISILDDPEANAAHIVRCVNMHDELVRALEKLAYSHGLERDEDFRNQFIPQVIALLAKTKE